SDSIHSNGAKGWVPIGSRILMWSPRDTEFHMILADSSHQKPQRRGRAQLWRKNRDPKAQRHPTGPLCAHADQRVGRREKFPRTVEAALDLDLALSKPARPDHDLPRNADKVSGGEFGTRPFVEIVVEHVDPLRGECRIELLASRIGVAA